MSFLLLVHWHKDLNLHRATTIKLQPFQLHRRYLSCSCITNYWRDIFAWNNYKLRLFCILEELVCFWSVYLQVAKFEVASASFRCSTTSTFRRNFNAFKQFNDKSIFSAYFNRIWVGFRCKPWSIQETWLFNFFFFWLDCLTLGHKYAVTYQSSAKFKYLIMLKKLRGIYVNKSSKSVLFYFVAPFSFLQLNSRPVDLATRTIISFYYPYNKFQKPTRQPTVVHNLSSPSRKSELYPPESRETRVD